MIFDIKQIMDCRTTDFTVTIREGSIVSVSSDHFDQESKTEKYYGRVVRIIQEREQARVKLEDDESFSVERIDDK